MATLPIALVVHGHFYQPPRENPWTDTIEREPSAAPLHDWNARIHAECYRANAWARIHDAKGRIEAIVNNYARMSYNFGPTLARWIERHDPETHERLRVAEGDHIGHDLARDSLRHTVSEGGVTVVQKARDTLLTRSRNF